MLHDVEVLLHRDLGSPEPSLSVLVVIELLLVNILSVTEHFEVVVKLFFVESVDCLHVLHDALKNLHFLLKLDFLLLLVVGIVGSQLLELFGVLLVLESSLLHLLDLKVSLLLEETFVVILVSLQNPSSLVVEGRLDSQKVLLVVLSGGLEVVTHQLDKLVNVVVLLLESLVVLLVFVSELILELRDEVFLLRNNLAAGFLLDLDVLGQLLAVFLLLELLPGPVNFDILLVRSNDLSVDLIVALFLFLFFTDASHGLSEVGFGSYLGDNIMGLLSTLFQQP